MRGAHGSSIVFSSVYPLYLSWFGISDCRQYSTVAGIQGFEPFLDQERVGAGLCDLCKGDFGNDCLYVLNERTRLGTLIGVCVIRKYGVSAL